MTCRNQSHRHTIDIDCGNRYHRNRIWSIAVAGLLHVSVDSRIDPVSSRLWIGWNKKRSHSKNNIQSCTSFNDILCYLIDLVFTIQSLNENKYWLPVNHFSQWQLALFGYFYYSNLIFFLQRWRRKKSEVDNTLTVTCQFSKEYKHEQDETVMIKGHVVGRDLYLSII